MKRIGAKLKLVLDIHGKNTVYWMTEGKVERNLKEPLINDDFFLLICIMLDLVEMRRD